MRMALEVEQLALNEKGKESIAIEAFARALKQIPMIIADNAGFDSSELISNLKNSIHNGSTTAGININDGTVGDMKELGVYECLKVKEQALISACEAAEMIIRVDMTFTAPPRPREKE
jgi:T-complex protein 1 subunit beta